MTKNCDCLISSRKSPTSMLQRHKWGLMGLNEFIYNKNALNTLVNYDKNHN